MNHDPFNFWKSQETEANFSSPGACQSRASQFEKVVKRRNRMEFAAGAFVIFAFTVVAAFFGSVGEWAIVVSVAMIIAAAIFVIARLHFYGSVERRNIDQSCRDYLREQLVRQRDLLRGVPKWYLAPFVPGLVGFYVATAARVAELKGWSAAVEDSWFVVVAWISVFGFAAWYNLQAARKLDRQITALDMV